MARPVDLAAGERVIGPLLLGRSGERLNRQAATRIVVCLASGPAYDRARRNLDRHASYIVTAFVAGAS